MKHNNLDAYNIITYLLPVRLMQMVRFCFDIAFALIAQSNINTLIKGILLLRCTVIQIICTITIHYIYIYILKNYETLAVRKLAFTHLQALNGPGGSIQCLSGLLAFTLARFITLHQTLKEPAGPIGDIL